MKEDLAAAEDSNNNKWNPEKELKGPRFWVIARFDDDVESGEGIESFLLQQLHEFLKWRVESGEGIESSYRRNRFRCPSKVESGEGIESVDAPADGLAARLLPRGIRRRN